MKSFFTIFILIPFFFFQNAKSQVREGNFEKGLGTWETSIVGAENAQAEPPTAKANFSAVSPGLGNSAMALFVEVVNPGKYDWYISATNRVNVRSNNTFELYFRAKADVKRKISVALYSDINNGQPFFSKSIEISTEEKKFGPFKMYYEEIPVRPGIKLFFGGEVGNVTIDELVLEQVPTVIEIETQNTLDDVIGDITLPHEGLPHGASHFDWGKAPRAGAKNPPDDWTAAIAWGQLYEWINGNPATNTRVQIRDLQMYYLSKSDGLWHELQKSLLVEGAAYREDFAGDINKPADIRNEPDGSISVTAGDGYNFHFWPKTGRVLIPKGDVAGCFVSVNCRLILNDPNGIDDRDKARFLMGVGGDWWESMTAVWDNWTTNWDMGIGRFRFVTKEWQGHNLITLSPEETLLNPPPLPKSATSNHSEILTNDFPDILTNYPNPFNNSTRIKYLINENTNVKIDVFSIDGKHLSTLINEPQTAGQHEVIFNATEFNKGIYFYTLTTGKIKQTRKMIIAK